MAITAMLMCCKEPYNPPAISQGNHFLVVDGTIISGPDSTVIKISRTRNFNDSVNSSLELQAQVFVVDPSGGTISLINQGSGRYVIDQLNLDNTKQYQLKIIAADGKEYLSDLLTVKPTPAIDSITWSQDNTGVTVYVNTHDPQNSTIYYKWDFSETWQYYTAFQTYADIEGGVPVPRFDQIYTCWLSSASTDIEVASSAKLSEDVIYRNPIQFIPQGSEKIGEKYSIYVRQFAIEQQAYEYWVNLKKNTEQLGTLFDGQPSQLNSNIHCVSTPEEPVLGFIQVSTVTKQRMFISKNDLVAWGYTPYWKECVYKGFTDPDSIKVYFPDDRPRRYVFLGTDLGTYLYTTLMCGDCRDHGGTNVKPSFWP